MPLTKRAEEVIRRRKKFGTHSSHHRFAWDKVRENLGLMHKCWHTWRHTTATRLTEKNWIQQISCDIWVTKTLQPH